MVIPEGTYFMMGDHRSISQDSRAFGPVERGLIYGKAVFMSGLREMLELVRSAVFFWPRCLSSERMARASTPPAVPSELANFCPSIGGRID